MYVVKYRWPDCSDQHDGTQQYRTEGGAREQADLHNGLCPHYGVPMACAIVEDRPNQTLDANDEVIPA